ncbi:MAG: AbrB/MazE/SpoVT family DNA-binding domain-containing protein [Oscillospiraceae bacterium]|jgi:antitoxin MazE|nr:AbrB/MazE/SpoVT family DNA-binding domain-containing protein [Oscillospiraceae bacterium]
METTTSYWGNALGFRIPRSLQEISNITDKTRIRIEAEPNKLIITKISEPRKRMTLAERLSEYPIEEYLQQEEVDWGAPVGEEVW